MTRMRFGIFLAPFHPAGINPTLLLDSDLELIDHLDRLGFDEAWIGEHHSAGTEIIASPEIFIAAAAAAHPAHQARHRRDQRQLPQPALGGRAGRPARPHDRGRFMLGLGPGALPSDAAMIGLDMPQTRELLEDAVDVITRLCRSDEPVTSRTSAGTCATPGCTCGRTPTRTRRSPSPRWPRRPGRASPAATGTGCCRSAPPPPPASTCSACTGT